MPETETIKILKSVQGCIVEFGPRTVFVRRNPNEQDQMATIRLMTTKGRETNASPLIEEDMSPLAYPSEECYIDREPLGIAGFGTIIFYYVMFGLHCPELEDMPENVKLEAEEFAFRLHQMIKNGFADGDS